MKLCFRFVLFGLILLTAASACTPTQVPPPPTTAPNPTREPTQASAQPVEQTCATVNILYHERPPYAVTEGQAAKGLTASPTGSAFEKAGIPVVWLLTPSKRQLLVIQENQGCDCSIGWFKNPEREQFAQFTSPIYQDQPQIAIARADNDKVNSGGTVAEMLKNPNLILGVKDGYSYGKFLDEQIATWKPKTDVTTAENTNMLEKVHKGYNDYFFMAPEEADPLISAAGLPQADFKYVTFTDMPQGEKRYIICSKKVEPGLIEKLNQALATIVNLP